MSRDWKDIETEYITTNISYSKLAEKHGVPEGTLSKYAAKNKWFQKRKDYTEKMVAKTTDGIASQEAEKLTKLKIATDTMTKVIDDILADTQQFYRHIVECKGTKVIENNTENPDVMTLWSEEQIFKKADTKAIRDIVMSLKELTSLVRNLNNIPTQAEWEARQLAMQRLELDKKKADVESNENKEIRIYIEGDAEDYSE